MKLSPGNIWSGNSKLAVFTNPTELAFRKGNLKNHYPITYLGKQYPDSEAAYQAHTRNCKADFEKCKAVCVDILIAKLEQYPALVETIWQSGGIDWIEKCSHIVGAKTSNFKRWEGCGGKSAYIDCLAKAYAIVAPEDDAQVLRCNHCEKDVYSRPYEVPFKNGQGFHLRADCPECGKFIKFVAQ